MGRVGMRDRGRGREERGNTQLTLQEGSNSLGE